MSEVIRSQKKKYIEEVMALTPEEKNDFWRVYAQYDAGLAKIRVQRMALATDFLSRHGELSDTEALDMSAQKLRIDSDELKFKQSFVAGFMAVLPGRKVLRLYQTENRFDIRLRLRSCMEIYPLLIRHISRQLSSSKIFFFGEDSPP